ncbi:MAG: MFS transporter [Hamadaea sp.]|uniref:MDR family MFS transporter n=1 Tax=Hamadaea sp. TaxID=2024425 RepID=UPI0018011F80|nr:MDR family MFS transporter [Hamadaea sp.]NUR74472.1 MFS transporter [Hamadaea sp.]NUT24069.1 MFS transporter [Hamadaea sp.]
MEQTDQAPITRADVGFRSDRGPLLISLMLSIGLVAIDSTVIATAVPSVVESLGGFHQFPWLFSVYLLAQAVTVPIYGKLADLFGRKPMMLLGIGFFLAGSILCGFAWSMLALIVFRAVQGLGAGAIQPMSMTIVGDVYTTAERGKVQGYIASVWAVSSVVGPTLGGVFSQFATWRWIFFINIPLCLLAAFMLMRNLREDVVRRKPVLDYRGAVLLTTGVTLLILGLLEGGEAWSWTSWAGIGVPAAGLALLIAFVLVERRAAEPVVPLWVFRRRILLTGSLVSAGVGMVLFGLTSYVPAYVQGVLGTGPLVAGFALATFTLGWPLAASQSGRAYMRFGFRTTAIIGSSVAIAGCLLTTFLGTHTPVWVVGAVCFVVGLGMGWTAAPTLIAAQATVGWSERGVVTAANMFSRSVGGAVGVALFGAIANFALPDLARASSHVFISVAVIAILMGAAVVAMPRTPVAAQ